MTFLLSIPGIIWSFLRHLTWQQVLAGAAAVGGALLYRAGRKSAQKDQQLEDLEAGQDMKEIQDDVARLDSDQRRDALGRFVRPD
jgi:hypothetical protein